MFHDDDPSRPAFERFKNMRAEMWWGTRRRFEKTFELVNGISKHPHSECISLPKSAHETIAQLALPLLEYSEDRRIRIEGKRKMRSRGISSPDHADSLVLCYSNISPPELMLARAWG